MYYDSYNWDREVGVCKKHMMPSIPCPACMAEPIDEDVFIVMSELDSFMVDLEESKETGD